MEAVPTTWEVYDQLLEAREAALALVPLPLDLEDTCVLLSADSASTPHSRGQHMKRDLDALKTEESCISASVQETEALLPPLQARFEVVHGVVDQLSVAAAALEGEADHLHWQQEQERHRPVPPGPLTTREQQALHLIRRSTMSQTTNMHACPKCKRLFPPEQLRKHTVGCSHSKRQAVVEAKPQIVTKSEASSRSKPSAKEDSSSSAAAVPPPQPEPWVDTLSRGGNWRFRDATTRSPEVSWGPSGCGLAVTTYAPLQIQVDENIEALHLENLQFRPQHQVHNALLTHVTFLDICIGGRCHDGATARVGGPRSVCTTGSIMIEI